MIEVQTIGQLTLAVRKLRSNCSRGMGTMELIRSLEIDPVTELRGGDWRGTDFASCDLRNTDFSECRLAFCDFTGADVAGAVFYGADLYRSTLHRALNVPMAYLSDDQLVYLERLNDFDIRGQGDEGRLFIINRKIQSSTTFQIAKTQFNTIMSSGLLPDQYSAGLLIGRTGSPEEAWEALDLIDGSEAKVNDVVFTALAAKMRTADDVRAVMNIMRDRGIAPGSRVYNTLLSRTAEPDDVEAVLGEMSAEAISRDNVTYAILMRRVGYVGRRDLFDQLLSDGLHPGTVELNILMRAARTEEEADEVLEVANEQEIKRDCETYALLAPYKLRTSAFRALVDDMIEDRLFRNSDFYALAIERAASFGDACFLLGRMASDGVQPDIQIYNHLRRLAGYLPEKLDPDQAKWPELAIASLVRRFGAPADITAAALDE